MRALLAAAVLCLMIAGCDDLSRTGAGSKTPKADTAPPKADAPVSLAIGSECTVQFRRGDALGAGGSLPVPPTTDSMNGADVSATGKLLRVDAEWVVLEEHPRNSFVAADPREQPGLRQLWIPRSAVLMLVFPSVKGGGTR
jgi:hypothetical protein